MSYILFSCYASGSIRVREGELFETLEQAQQAKAEYESDGKKRGFGQPAAFRLFKLEEVIEAS